MKPGAGILWLDQTLFGTSWAIFDKITAKIFRTVVWLLVLQQQGIPAVLSFRHIMTPHQTTTNFKNLESKTAQGDSAVDEFSSSPSALNSNYHHVKGVIFDLDGTLIDSWKLGFDATQIILSEHGIEPITQEVYHDCTKYTTPDRLSRHAGLQPGDADFETVGQALAREFDELYVGMVTTQTAGFYPGIDDLLRQLYSKQVVLGALTNACADYAHAVLKANSEAMSLSSDRHKLYSSFQSIRAADNVPAPKPFPDGLLQVCQDLDLSPECCVYVGDSPSDGMAAASAGMPSIGVLWGSHAEDSLRKAPFSHLCRTVDELMLLLI
jgi:HAD superfamily hydrolase (TIGR01549 family)